MTSSPSVTPSVVDCKLVYPNQTILEELSDQGIFNLLMQALREVLDMGRRRGGYGRGVPSDVRFCLEIAVQMVLFSSFFYTLD